MQHTEKFQLSQWERTDRIQMQDFNADNAKIDAALAAHAAAIARRGNCRLETFTYTGTGIYGPSKPTVIHFSSKPAAFFVIGTNTLAAVYGSSASVVFKSGTSYLNVSWSGASVSLTTNNGDPGWQLTTPNVTYYVLALYDMS